MASNRALFAPGVLLVVALCLVLSGTHLTLSRAELDGFEDDDVVENQVTELSTVQC